MIECKEETKPKTFFEVVKRMTEYNLSEDAWCKSCSSAYKDVCMRVVNIFSLDTNQDTKFFNLIELRKKCHLLMCYVMYAANLTVTDFTYESLKIYKKGLVSLCDCIRQRVYHHENCISFINHKVENRYGDDNHFSFLIALCLEFLILYRALVEQSKTLIFWAGVKDFTKDIDNYYSDVIKFARDSFLHKFKKLKDCLQYVKERNSSIGIKNIDMRTFLIDLSNTYPNISEYEGDVYINDRDNKYITLMITEEYKEFNNVKKSPTAKFSYLKKRGRSSPRRMKPPRSVYDRLKTKSHLKFLKKLKEKGKEKEKERKLKFKKMISDIPKSRIDKLISKLKI
jgi:hypothetical protein